MKILTGARRAIKRLVKTVGVLGCVLGCAGTLRADMESILSDVVSAQRAHIAVLAAKNAVEAVPSDTDVESITRNFAANYLPANLRETSGDVTLAMDNSDSKIGSLQFVDESGVEHVFCSWITKRVRKPFCWIADGYQPSNDVDAEAIKTFLSGTVFSAGPVGGYIAQMTAKPVGQDAVIRSAFTKKLFSNPFSRAYVVFVDDNPLANWGHASRLVLVKDDLSAFVVWYLTEPVKVLDGDTEIALEELCKTIELPTPPTIEEIRNALKQFDEETLGSSEKNDIVTSGGDTSHSYAILISGGYNRYNNHTRYWGDIAAMYSTLTLKYGIPKSHIKVCMSDGTSSAADISSSSSSHSYFSGSSSPLDLDGDGSADVTHSATRSQIRSAFSSFSLSSSDQLFVFATDHGSDDDYGNAYICLWDEDEMLSSDFASLTSGLACPVAFAFEFCYSGGFISDLRSQSGRTRAIATAASYETSSAWNRTSSVTGISSSTGLYYMNPWVYYFVGATRGYFPQVSTTPYRDATSCSADTSGDGRVSIREASDYASSKIRADGYDETPNYGESSSGVGSSFYLVKNLPGRAAITLSTALDSTLSFSTGGSSPAWFGQSGITHDGTDAARSGAITHSQTNWVQTTVSGAGTVSFWWKVDSEENFDYLEFLVDGTVRDSISGSTSWALKTYTLSSGTHTLRWRYRKDGSVSSGQDSGFVDQVTWTPDVRTVITFGKNGGTGGTASVTAMYGSAMPSITPPTRAGYVFDGYYDTTGSGGTKYYNANGTSAHVWNKNVNTCTLFAKWNASLSLSSALDAALSFTTGGSSPAWYGQTSVTHDGNDAARSGAITHSQSNWMQTTVSGSGTVSFWWKVDSEANYDYLEFLVDDSVIWSISGSVAWQQKSYTISSSGSHTLKWRYRKDGSASSGLDAGFVDQLIWRGSTTITFGKNGGTGGTDSVIVQYDSDMPTITPPTRAGYEFDGYWDTTGTGGTKYYNADGTSAHKWDKNVGTYTLWAKWNRVATISLSTALDTALSFSGGGNSPAWYGQSSVTHDGVDAVRSGAITHSQSNWIQTTVNGSGSVSFWWKVDSESGCDFLEFLVDNSVIYSISGSVSWQQKSYTISSSGSHTLMWRYRKDGSVSSGLDAGFVDQLVWNGNTVVTFGKNAGIGGTTSVTATFGYSMPSITTPTRSGYVFDGYYDTTSTGGTKYYNSDGSSAHVWNKTSASCTLWAKWIRVDTSAFSSSLDTSLSFSVGGSAPAWYSQTSVTHDGVDALRSGAISHGQSTWFQSTVNGTGRISFWWRVDSEEDFDYLRFIVDDVEVYSISGSNVAWQQKTYEITASGSHTLRWVYSKDGSVSSGLDAGFVDQVSWIGGVTSTAITFGKNGGTGGTDSVTARYGEAMPSITPPTRSGYVFDGYVDTTASGGKKYYNADGSSARNWDKRVSSCTLWAKWKRAYTVTFGKNGGTGGSDSTRAVVGEPMLMIIPPVRSGWTFGGYWSTTGANGVKYYNEDGTSAHLWDISANTALWALWYRSSCTITFGKNGGTGGSASVTASYGAAMPSITPPTRSGYLFAGYWDTTGEDGKKYYNADGSSARSWDKATVVTTTLWAKWDKAYTITFGKNGGTGGSDRTTQAVVGKPMPAIVIPTRSGWTFGGYWTSTGSGGVMYYDAQGRSARNWDRAANMTLWALWTRTYRVTLNRNGGTGGTASVTVSSSRELPSIIIPTRTGYRFGGYWTTLQAGGVQYYDESGLGTRPYDLNTDTTLLAFWISINAFGNAALHPSLVATTQSGVFLESEGLLSGILADGTGRFAMLLDESSDGTSPVPGCFALIREERVEVVECEVSTVGTTWIVFTEDGNIYVVSMTDSGLVAQRRIVL